MTTLQLVTLILSVIGKAIDLAQRIIAVEILDPAAAKAALEQADAALSTASQALGPALAQNDAKVDSALAAQPIGKVNGP